MPASVAFNKTSPPVNFKLTLIPVFFVKSVIKTSSKEHCHSQDYEERGEATGNCCNHTTFCSPEFMTCKDCNIYSKKTALSGGFFFTVLRGSSTYIDSFFCGKFGIAWIVYKIFTESSLLFDALKKPDRKEQHDNSQNGEDCAGEHACLESYLLGGERELLR